MKGTVEIDDSVLDRLESYASRRGDADVSSVIAEAVGHYLADDDVEDEGRIRAALDAIGSLTAEEGAELQGSVEALRARWR